MYITDVFTNYAPMGTYNIGFNEDDETQFFATDLNDLMTLWDEFCKENDFNKYKVDYVDLVENELDILEEFLERTGASIFKGVCEWHVTEDGDMKTFPDRKEMIRHMAEQNEIMRG